MLIRQVGGREYLLLYSFIFFLSGCATHQLFETNLHSYIGQPSSEIIQTFGPPKQVITINTNETVWSYEYSRHSYVGGGSSSFYQPFGGTDYFNQTNATSSLSMTEIIASCNFWFLIDKNHLVKGVGDKGNRCKENKNGSFMPPDRAIGLNSPNSGLPK